MDINNQAAETDPDPYPTTDLVVVVDRVALIENLINRIITDYCSPRQEAWFFMWSIVLDTSVMSLGAKTKVVMAVAQEMKFMLDKNAIHTVVALRNAFAHNASDANFIIAPGPLKETIYHELWILGSSGKIEKKKRHEAFAEFNEAYRNARHSLIKLANLVTRSTTKTTDLSDGAQELPQR